MLRVIAAGLAICFALSAQASTLTIEVSEDTNGNVLFTGSGSIDLLSATLEDSAATLSTVDNVIAPNQFGGVPGSFLGTTSNADVYFFADGVIASSITTTSSDFSATLFDSVFAVETIGTGGLNLSLDANYASSDPISFTWVAQNTTVSALGVTFGVIATFGGNTIVTEQGTLVSSGPVDATIPLPASLGLLVASLPFLIRRRRKSAT